MNVMYGIPNCSTVKKARTWLEANGIAYRFHDFRKDGLTQSLLNTFIDDLGWEALLNRSGMTWRKLPDSAKAMLDKDRASLLMLAHPAVIKRPLLNIGSMKTFHPGFNETHYKNLFTTQE